MSGRPIKRTLRDRAAGRRATEWSPGASASRMSETVSWSLLSQCACWRVLAGLTSLERCVACVPVEQKREAQKKEQSDREILEGIQRAIWRVRGRPRRPLRRGNSSSRASRLTAMRTAVTLTSRTSSAIVA